MAPALLGATSLFELKEVHVKTGGVTTVTDQDATISVYVDKPGELSLKFDKKLMGTLTVDGGEAEKLPGTEIVPIPGGTLSGNVQIAVTVDHVGSDAVTTTTKEYNLQIVEPELAITSIGDGVRADRPINVSAESNTVRVEVYNSRNLSISLNKPIAKAKLRFFTPDQRIVSAGEFEGGDTAAFTPPASNTYTAKLYISKIGDTIFPTGSVVRELGDIQLDVLPFQIEKVLDDGKLTWPGTPATVPIRTSSRDISLSFPAVTVTPDKSVLLYRQVPGSNFPEKLPDTSVVVDENVHQFSIKLPSRAYTYKVVVLNKAKTVVESPPLTLVPPSDAATLPIAIQHARVGVYGSPVTDFSGTGITTAGKMLVQGVGNIPTVFEVFLGPSGAAAHQTTIPPITRNVPGGWEAEFSLPTTLLGDLPNVSGFAYPVAQNTDIHRFAESPVKFQFIRPTQLPQPSLLGAVEPTSGGGREPSVLEKPMKSMLFTKSDAVWLVFEKPDVTETTELLVIDSRTGKVVHQETAPFDDKANAIVTDSTQFAVKMSIPTPGEYQFQALFAHAGVTSAASSPIHVHVRRVGPVVSNVDSRDFSFETGGDSVVIQFNSENPLNPETALDTKKFTLSSAVGLNDGQRIDLVRDIIKAENVDTDEGLTEAIAKANVLLPNPYPTSVDFDPSTNSVKLTFTDLNPGIYKLTVSKELIDVFGNELKKSSTQPTGARHTIELVKAAGTLPPTVTRGISGVTGPPVEFPEYTPPRPPTNGFNPSDKVVTAVARLYYFRDAHRVAQIINRKVKSYNRQQADTNQVIADRALSTAERAVFERRAEELRAVRAAQSARQSEEMLESLQKQQEQAERSEDSATRQLVNVRSNIAQIQRDLENPNLTPEVRSDLQKRLQDAERTRDVLQLNVTGASTDSQQLQQQIASLQATVQANRQKEIEAMEEWEAAEAEEELAFRESFRRSVTAARTDPDTYAPATLKSVDPVMQVSVSVVGEGEVHLRGPRKGVNIVRLMINQLDAPVGQVRVQVHTVQVNGEHGNRMEPVVTRIQRYIDHARFLTTRSAQMLRNAVVLVASRRAEAVNQACPNDTQAMRDRKYLIAFFGQDMIRELELMDSEFLHTGNKLLSIHSMDTTSLASALFMLALAKNDVRHEILFEFEQLVGSKLPWEEQEYFTASGAEFQFGPPLCKEEFKFFAHNAKFVSLRGMFDAELAGADTLSPFQREFIRLAQVFKSRLITEVEWRQRVMQRSVIEERLGDYYEELLKARSQEDQAIQALRKLESESNQQRVIVLRAASRVVAEAKVQRNAQLAAEKTSAELSKFFSNFVEKVIEASISGKIEELEATFPDSETEENKELLEAILERMVNDEEFAKYKKSALDEYRSIYKDESSKLAEAAFNWRTTQWGPLVREYYRAINERLEASENPIVKHFRKMNPGASRLRQTFELGESKLVVELDDNNDARLIEHENWQELSTQLDNQLARASQIQRAIQPYVSPGDKRWEGANALLAIAQTSAANLAEYPDNVLRLRAACYLYGTIAADQAEKVGKIAYDLEQLIAAMSRQDADITLTYRKWIAVRTELSQTINSTGEGDVLSQHLGGVDRGFQELLLFELKRQFAVAVARDSRRDLDHKKFLDMFVDDVEEKYIDLLEGTRAHTAVVDAYIKRIATALEDDFNTQFYFPAFRALRETSRYWDVNLSAIQTESVLTNNREFAKVMPQATMEFDLPKRDILINEAFESAYAAYSDYGALMADPNFLALTKMYSGQPPASAFNVPSSSPLVRDVVPSSLPTSVDQDLMIQTPGTPPQFGSQLEALIPDPAVYKFETGTGFEIRPVIQPDGQAVVFRLHYMYTTNVREPVRADEKHLGRVKRHFVDTDVQLGNYELREVSRFQVGLKASRTSRGVPFLEDVPGLGLLFRPLPQQESSLQENLILAQATIYPTLFDLMGLRWAPAVADLDPLALMETEHVARGRHRKLEERVYDYSGWAVDDFLRVPPTERRPDLYREQYTVPHSHPNGYEGSGLNFEHSKLHEGYSPTEAYPETRLVPRFSSEGKSVIRSLGEPTNRDGVPPRPMSFHGDPGVQFNPNTQYTPQLEYPTHDLAFPESSIDSGFQDYEHPTEGALNPVLDTSRNGNTVVRPYVADSPGDTARIPSVPSPNLNGAYGQKPLGVSQEYQGRPIRTSVPSSDQGRATISLPEVPDPIRTDESIPTTQMRNKSIPSSIQTPPRTIFEDGAVVRANYEQPVKKTKSNWRRWLPFKK
ncbi:coiled-coil domain-containing protein [Thalassoroseus pseudoceratinae]|uniref:hypothetical protein n=1 Tax=Thalassoroseus pseudoceratinae TaxID=2713176 RepID=UPI00142165A7|nr:hypothetical protein [Thalassoroseus pseudoceratinae]